MVLIGKKSTVIEKRMKESLQYAITQIKESGLRVNHVYLYGSCARGTQRYTSDVDILVEFAEGTKKEEILKLRGRISPVSLDLPPVDMHAVTGDAWRKSSMLYYKNIKREGMDIWDTENTHI